MFLLWLSVPVGFWGAYLWLTRGGLTRHIAFLHFAVYFFAIYLSSYGFYQEQGAVNDRFIFSVMAYPILALAGMWLAHCTHPRMDFAGSTVRRLPRERTLVAIMVFFFLAVYAIYLRSLGDNIPLLMLLRGAEPIESRVARFLATKGYEGAMGGLRLFFWLPRVLIDYLSAFVVVFAYYWMHRRRSEYLAFVGICIVFVLLGFLQVEKYPAIRLAAVLALCHLNFHNRRVGLRSLRAGALIVVTAVAFAGVVYSVVSGAFRELGTASLLTRATTTVQLGQDLLATRGQVGQMTPLYYTYELVPDRYEYFGGRTLSNPRGILPYEPVIWPYLLFAYKNVNDPGVTGSDPTVFFGEVYVNWGLTFSFLLMITLGYLMQRLHHGLARNIDQIGTTFDYAFFYLVSVYLMDFALGFTTPWFDERIYIFVLLYWVRKYVVMPSTAARQTRASDGPPHA